MRIAMASVLFCIPMQLCTCAVYLKNLFPELPFRTKAGSSKQIHSCFQAVEPLHSHILI